MRLHVFDRTDGIKTGLHQNAAVDDCAAFFVVAGLLDERDIHHDPCESGEAAAPIGDALNEYGRPPDKVNVSLLSLRN